MVAAGILYDGALVYIEDGAAIVGDVPADGAGDQ